MYKYKSIAIPISIPEIKKNLTTKIFFNNNGPNDNRPKIILLGLFIFVVYHNYKDMKKYIKIF